MPSFFEGLRRMLKGEAVYRPGEDTDGDIEYKDEIQARQAAEAQQQPGGSVTPPPAEAQVRQDGDKIVPQATIVKVENRISGDYLDISLTIQNNSQIDVELSAVSILGRAYKLSHVLPPGRMQEFVSVYNGPRLTHRNYTDCEVYYNKPGSVDVTRDGFKANHYVEFQQEADGTYTISRIRFLPPVEDI